jgi:hypothetical protein
MRQRCMEWMATAVVAAMILCAPNSAAAQDQKAAAKKPYNLKRLADGHPDLQGTYDLATLTPVDRPSGASAVYTPEQAKKIEGTAALQREQGDKALAAERTAPPKGGDGSTGPAGNVGGYNTGWLDPGTKLNVVAGQIRSSIIVDPPDGRAPRLLPAAVQRAADVRVGPASDVQENTNDPGLEKAPGAYDDPERRPLGERCLLGFGSTSGPPALPDYFYNNLHQIVQTTDAVMILTEMVHDARIIRLNAQHLPKNIRLWMGDSVGHWEGDTLVVDTTNFTNKTRFRGSTENLHVVERFSRMDAHTLLYRFTVEDPETWAKSWTGEMAWPETDGKIYEYACHEGNYALTDILKGARLREKEQAAAKAASRDKE